jgi:hypothetical protein
MFSTLSNGEPKNDAATKLSNQGARPAISFEAQIGKLPFTGPIAKAGRADIARVILVAVPS